MRTSAEIMASEEKEPRCVALDSALDLNALKASLCAATYATGCVELVKLVESGFHRIYIARMNNGAEVLARVAYENAIWKASRKMESEVATIQWLVRNTDLPVPKILFSCVEPNNPVGAAYMIMEKIPGRPLSKFWFTMSEAQRDQIVVKLAQFTVDLIKATPFDQIGSLYGDGDTISIGPMIPPFNPVFFRKDFKLDHGPWSSGREYLLACVRREIEWISANQEELANKWKENGTDLEKEELVARYTTILRKLENYVASMGGLDVRYEGVGPFVLRHADFNPMNIMVREDDPTIITGIVDWDAANTVPLWVVAQAPDFLLDTGDDFEGDPAERASKSRLRDLFIKAASEALPGAFADANEAVKTLRLGRLEQAVQIVSTYLDLNVTEHLASPFLDGK